MVERTVPKHIADAGGKDGAPSVEFEGSDNGSADVTSASSVETPPGAPMARIPKSTLIRSYATLLAKYYFIAQSRKYSRIREKIQPTSGACTRSVEVDWRLPALSEFFPSESIPEIGSQERWIVPLWPMRRGQILSNLEVRANGNSVRILSRHRSMELTTAVIELEWQNVMSDLIGLQLGQSLLEPLETAIYGHIDDMVKGTALEARSASTEVEKLLSRLVDIDHLPSLKRLIAAAKFLSRRHLLWIETDCQPGDVMMLRYSYATRFAAEYGSPLSSSHGIPGLYATFKRFIGQTPAEYSLPISRHGLSRSYHVYSEAPDHCFFSRFEFADQSRSGISREDFVHRAETAHADVGGDEDFGGPFGHLYLYRMPSAPGHHSIVNARVMEIPPGAIAPVSSLVTITTMALAFVSWRWEPVMAQGQQTYFLAASAVLAAFATVWFSHNFEADGRRRIPIAARAGLVAVSMASLATLIASALVALYSDEPRPGGFSLRSVYIGLVLLPLAISTIVIWQQRIHFYRTYRKGQRVSLQRYGL